LELAGGIAGPYAGRLLAMLGATVAKIEPGGGDPARRKPVDDVVLAEGEISPLYLHLNAGKRNVSPGLLPLGWADVVIADRVRRQVAGTELDPERLRDAGGPLLVTVSAWGYEADEPGAIEDELLVEARAGAIAATGDADRPPLRLPGWQGQYQAGATAAVAALAGLRLAGVVHIDVPWLAALQVGVELEFADRLFAGRSRPPAGPFPPAAFPGGALPCRDGYVCPGSFRDVDWEMQTLFYGMPELRDDERFATRLARAGHVDELWALIEGWYRSHTKAEIFEFALESPWTVGMVVTGRDALTDPHLAERGAIGTIEGPNGRVRAGVRPFLLDGVPVADQRVRATGEDDGWARSESPGADAPVSDPTGGGPARRERLPRSTAAVRRRPLDGTRLVELTVAWAGPFVGNLLGSLGADVLRIDAATPFEGYRLLRLHADSDPDRLAHLKGTRDWLEASSLFCAVNRNKRGVALQLDSGAGRQVFLDLVRNTDAVLCNFTTRVMPQLGLAYEDLAAVNPGVVLVRMPAWGTRGPYSHCAGYALSVEAMGGFAARWGYEDEGARVSDHYWPDSVAGTHAALAVLTGLERRDRTGNGCEIDLAHQEAMWLQGGEALIVADQRGADIGRMGNREPGVAGSGIEPDGSGGWLAVVGERREPVLDVLAAARDERQSWRFETVERAHVGSMRLLRPPLLVNGAPVTTRRPAPTFDQHTDEVLREVAGYGDAGIGELRDEGVIGGQLPDPAAAGW
jgi:crotonobetainyl-CoA:carnitine CoA-transferase CaiB-like acyl-CoA transferase